MRILIVGASGFLGSNIALGAGSGDDLVLHSSSQGLAVGASTSVVMDLMVPGSGGVLVADVRPDLVVNCAALADVDACEQRPEEAQRLNVELPAELAASCVEVGAGLVHVSTDAVFGAEPGPYTVETAVSPVNRYGRTKADGEVAVLGLDPGALVVRTNIVGFSPSGRRSLLEYFLGRLDRGQAAPGFVDVSFRPLLVDAFWPIVSAWVGEGRQGLVHATGPTFLSKYEFGRRVARTFGLDPDLVTPASVGDHGLGARRADSLDVVPSRPALGVDPDLADLDLGLSRLEDSMRSGLRARLAGLARD